MIKNKGYKLQELKEDYNAIEQKVDDIIASGQSENYKQFIRSFTQRATTVLKLKNPMAASYLVTDIDNLIEIINPELQCELTWLQELQSALKLWVNDMIISNRKLGLMNDNVFDTSVFENEVMNKYLLSNKPKSDFIVKADFPTLVELVELGARLVWFIK